MSGSIARIGAVMALLILTWWPSHVRAQDVFPVGAIAHPEPVNGDLFGAAVAVVGEWVCVGAPGRERDASTNVGAVYVFDRATRELVRRIDAPQVAFNARFGDVLQACGVSRVAIAAAQIGRVWMFDLPSAPTAIPIADPAPDNAFGRAMTSDGTLLVVSDPFETIGEARGGAHVYDVATGAFLRSIPHPNPIESNSSFGSSLLLDGDILYAGSIYSRTPPTPGAGEAYAIDVATGARLALYPDSTNGQNLLGASLAIAGGRVAVGPGYDDGFPYGYLYLYEGFDSEPVLTLRSPGLSNQSGNDRFGWAMATWRDELLVTAPRGPYDAEGERHGALYRHDPLTGAQLGRLLSPADNSSNHGMGESLAVSGDTVYMGAPGFDGPTSAPGIVYEFLLTPSPTSDALIVR